MRTKVMLAFLLEPQSYVCCAMIAHEYPEIGKVYIEVVDRYLSIASDITDFKSSSGCTQTPHNMRSAPTHPRSMRTQHVSMPGDSMGGVGCAGQLVRC